MHLSSSVREDVAALAAAAAEAAADQDLSEGAAAADEEHASSHLSLVRQQGHGWCPGRVEGVLTSGHHQTPSNSPWALPMHLGCLTKGR